MRKGCKVLKNKHVREYIGKKLEEGYSIDLSKWSTERVIYFVRGSERVKMYTWLSEKAERHIRYFVRLKKLGYTDDMAYESAFVKKPSKVTMQKLRGIK